MYVTQAEMSRHLQTCSGCAGCEGGQWEVLDDPRHQEPVTDTAAMLFMALVVESGGIERAEWLCHEAGMSDELIGELARRAIDIEWPCEATEGFPL